MTPSTSHVDFEDLLDIIARVESILLVKESFDQLPPVGKLPIRLSVWAQDFNYQLSRLSIIKEELVNEARSKCDSLPGGHIWKDDHIEMKHGEEMKKITYCDRCSQMK